MTPIYDQNNIDLNNSCMSCASNLKKDSMDAMINEAQVRKKCRGRNGRHHTLPESPEQEVKPKTWTQKARISMSEFLNFVGPGFLITIACLDPGNLSGDIAVGQETRFRLFWILILAHIMCYIYQSISLTIGCASGRDISTLCRYTFNKRTSISLWIMAELALIASDTQEVLGTAIGLHILFGVPLLFGVVISIVLAFAILHLQKYGQRVLESIFALFVLMMGVCFWINYLKIGPSFKENLRGLVPILKTSDLPVAVSLIGAIIMPQNLYLHSSLVLTRKMKPSEVKKGIKFFRLETRIVILLSLLINIAIIGTFSYFSDQKLLELKDASLALEHTLGFMGAIIWGVGLFASGQSATVAGALTGQYIMEGFLQIRMSRQKRMLITRMMSLVPCVLVIQLANIEQANIVLNIIQFVQLPFVLIPALKFCSNPDIMGEFVFKGRKFYTIIALTLFLIGLNVFQLSRQFPQTKVGLICGFLFMTSYFGFLVHIAKKKLKPIKVKKDVLEIELLSFGC